MTDLCRIDFLRHGESELSSVLRGSTDDALTAMGWVQMQDSVSTYQSSHPNTRWQRIFSSPLQRCEKFARQLAQQCQLELIEDVGLQEMHFGAWEGQSIAELYARYPQQLAQFWQQPSQFSPPQAETLQAFQTRVMDALVRIVQQMQKHADQHVLVVSHGGVIKFLKTIALKLDIDTLLSQSAELGQIHGFKVDINTLDTSGLAIQYIWQRQHLPDQDVVADRGDTC